MLLYSFCSRARGADANQLTQRGYSPLFLHLQDRKLDTKKCIQRHYQQLDAARSLLELGGADVNQPNGPFAEKVLHNTAKNRTVFQYLLEKEPILHVETIGETR
jgi:hypothetical protein